MKCVTLYLLHFQNFAVCWRFPTCQLLAPSMVYLWGRTPFLSKQWRIGAMQNVVDQYFTMSIVAANAQKRHTSPLRCESGNVQDKRGNILIFAWLRPRAPDLTHHLHNTQTLPNICSTGDRETERQMGREGGIRGFLTLSVSFKCESIFAVKELCGACVCRYHRSLYGHCHWRSLCVGPGQESTH